MNRRELLRLLIASPLFVIAGSKVSAKGSAYENFRAKYGDLASISLRYAGANIKGTLKARRGGWYHIDLGDKLFISDSRTIWQVQRSSKTVVLDSYRADNDQASIDKIFFVVFNVYVHQGTKDLGKGRKQLTLVAPSKDAVVAGVSQLLIVLNSKSNAESITVVEGDVRTKWTVSDVVLNPKLTDGEFRYAPPADWQVVDLR